MTLEEARHIVSICAAPTDQLPSQTFCTRCPLDGTDTKTEGCVDRLLKELLRMAEENHRGTDEEI